jgi:hypothetical protein
MSLVACPGCGSEAELVLDEQGAWPGRRGPQAWPVTERPHTGSPGARGPPRGARMACPARAEAASSSWSAVGVWLWKPLVASHGWSGIVPSAACCSMPLGCPRRHGTGSWQRGERRRCVMPAQAPPVSRYPSIREGLPWLSLEIPACSIDSVPRVASKSVDGAITTG